MNETWLLLKWIARGLIWCSPFYMRGQPGLRDRFRFRVTVGVTRFNLDSIRLQQLFVSPDFGMQSFSRRLCPLALPARGGHESTLLRALDAVGAGLAAVTFDLAAPADQTGMVFELRARSRFLHHHESTSQDICRAL